MNTMRKKELLIDFVADMREQLAEAERGLLLLEQGPGSGSLDLENVNSVFRAFHTVKGTAGFFEFKTIVSVAHEAEALLVQLRTRALPMKPGQSDVLLRVCDFLRHLIAAVEQSGTDKGHDESAQAIIGNTRSFLEVSNTTAPEQQKMWGLFKSPAAPSRSVSPEMLSHFAESARARIGAVLTSMNDTRRWESQGKEESCETLARLVENCSLLNLTVLADFFKVLRDHLSRELTEESRIASREILTTAMSALDHLPDQSGFEIQLRRVTEESQDCEIVLEVAASSIQKEDDAERATRRDIRIATEKLDAMMNLVGELVVAESLVTQHKDLRLLAASDFFSAARHLGQIVRNIQEAALSMRMVPISTAFDRMQRMVRDLALRSGKKVVLKIEGGDTEVDKTVAEMLSDPLVHILRNAIDHGLETPEQRLSVQKQETGTIRLSAQHSGNEVHVSIEDDGAGLDREKILDRARSQGLPVETFMADKDVWELIFLPGFSTARTVTDISGRGIGMDIVRKNIASLNGRIDVDSTSGSGTRFLLRIPLTLAIIEGLVARVGTAHFIFPTAEIKQSLQYRSAKISQVDDELLLGEFRGELFPLISLASALQMPVARETLCEKSLIVQIVRDRKVVGVVVDEILGNQHIVVKPLDGLVAHSPGTSGCTILGHGEIALIVDIGSLTKLVNYDHSVQKQVDSRENPLQTLRAVGRP